MIMIIIIVVVRILITHSGDPPTGLQETGRSPSGPDEEGSNIHIYIYIEREREIDR